MNNSPFTPKNPNIALANTDLTERIIKTFYEVANELGSGFVESIYLHALLIVFRQNGIRADSHVKFKVEFRGEILGEFYADIVVENKVIVELKAVSQLATEHSAQVINYLKASGLETGFLVNFGRPRLEIRHLYNPRLKRTGQDKRMEG